MLKQDNLLRYDARHLGSYVSKGAVRIIPEIRVVSNMYENENVPECLEFTVESNTEGELSVKTVLVMPYEEYSEPQSFKTVSGRLNAVALPDLTGIYGIFRLEISVFDMSGELLCEQSIPFSHLRTGGGYFKKSGTCVHLFRHDIPDTYQCFDHLVRCGIRIVRDDMLWWDNETEKGNPYVHDFYQKTAAGALERGIEPRFILNYWNQFYDEGKAPHTEEGLAAFCRYCAEVVKYFKGKIKLYEVWNEYNLRFGKSDGNPETYAWMLKEVYKTVKSVDPDATVSAGVTCGTQPEWIRRMLNAGTYDYFDQISIHPYCGWPDYAYPDEDQGQAERNVQCYKDVIAEFGETKPVWISEMGWTTGAVLGSTDREVQAASIARLFAVTETSDIIEALTFYDFRNDGEDPYNMECHWGLVEAQSGIVPNAAKESYAAVSCLNYMIGNAELVSKDVTAKIKHTVFEENGGKINVLWSLDGKKTVTLKVSNDAEIYDMYGNKRELKAENGVVTLDINENITYIKGAEAEVISSRKPDKLVYDFPYTLSAVPELKEDGWYIKAVVHNHSRVLDGRLRIEMPELELSGNYERFTIADGESFAAEIKVGEADYKKLYRALADINLTNGERQVKSELVSFLNIPYGDEKAVINLSSKERYVRIGGEECPELDAEIKMSYDEENLYLDAVVLDKSHLQLGTTGDTWKDIWDGDGLELIVQPLYDGNREITRYSQIGLALTSNKHEKIAWRWRTVSNRSNARMYNCEFDAVREPDRTVYKAVFKWSDLLPPNVELEDCDSFGFVLRVNYADSDPDSIDGYLQLYSGLGSWRKLHSYQPGEFGRFVLGKKNA